MAKKKGRAGDKPAGKPKSMRKQLRKAEADLAKATAKRDKAQARVEALSIIADEIRAQLADVDKAAAKAKTASRPKKERGQSAEAPTTKSDEPAAGQAAPVRKTTGGRRQATRAADPAKRAASARQAASAASRSASATTTTTTRQGGAPRARRKPASQE